MTYFKMVSCPTLHNKEVERLKAIKTDANIVFIIDFISELLPKIIHHRNQLKHYRSAIPIIREHFNEVMILTSLKTEVFL